MSEHKEESTLTASILDAHNRGSVTYEDIKSTMITEVSIFSKTALEWERQFRVPISKDPTPHELIEAGRILLDHSHLARFYLSCAELTLDTIKNGRESNYNEKYAEVVDQFQQEQPGKKLPAADTLAALSRDGIKETETTLATAESILKFWKTTVAGLESKRKIIETMTWNLSVDAKINPPNQADTSGSSY